MGIYIDGLQMPAKGCIKNVIILSSGQVIETTPGCSPQPEKQNYTAISVPPHGRLIDADAMIRDIEKSIVPSWYIKERNADMVKFLSLEDTIIPAEEGSDG